MDEQPQRAILDHAGQLTLILIVALAIALSRLLPAQSYTPAPQYSAPVATLAPINVNIDSHDDRRVCVIVFDCD